MNCMQMYSYHYHSFFQKKICFRTNKKKMFKTSCGVEKNPENVANFHFLCILSGSTCRLDYKTNYTFTIDSINKTLKRFVKRN